MPDYEARCAVLERENDDLRDRVEQLEAALGMGFDSPAFLGLTANEAKIFGMLLKRDSVTRVLVMDLLYGDRPDADEAEIKIVDVWVCKMRKKLKPYGIEVKTNWGQGYYMTAATKATARALIESQQAAA